MEHRKNNRPNGVVSSIATDPPAADGAHVRAAAGPPKKTRRRKRRRVYRKLFEENAVEENGSFTPVESVHFQIGDGTPEAPAAAAGTDDLDATLIARFMWLFFLGARHQHHAWPAVGPHRCAEPDVGLLQHRGEGSDLLHRHHRHPRRGCHSRLPHDPCGRRTVGRVPPGARCAGRGRPILRALLHQRLRHHHRRHRPSSLSDLAIDFV